NSRLGELEVEVVVVEVGHAPNITALGVALAQPAAPTGAEVEADEAGSAVVAAGDVPVGDRAPVDVGGIDDRAGDRGAGGDHRRRGAGTADREPALLALVAGAVIDGDARGGVSVERDVGGGPEPAAVDLAVLAVGLLGGRGRLV